MQENPGTNLPLRSLRILHFRSASNVVLEPGLMTALIGEPGTGKSNLLAAIWKLLDAKAPILSSEDITTGRARRVRIEATLAGGSKIVVTRLADGGGEVRTGTPPPALFCPAARRSERVVLGLPPLPSNGGALPTLVDFVQGWIDDRLRGRVLLIEEPELFLRPQGQRALYRLLREFAELGNQVIYSTHASTFLSVGRLEEITFVTRDLRGRTHVRRPEPLPKDDAFRALSEFDAERSELLLARSALLVEGRTEKLVFPVLFRALGYDVDLEGISIIECGGKPNIPIIAAVCNLTSIPYVVVHDRDALPGKRPIASERAVNAAIAAVAGPERTIELAPDFEAIAHLQGHRHKPERAWHLFELADSPAVVPGPLAQAVHRAVDLARS
jgi:hypothetical protein